MPKPTLFTKITDKLALVWRYILYFLPCTCLGYFLFNPHPSLSMIGITAAFTGILLVEVSMSLNQIKFLESTVRNLKLAEYQDRILEEIRASNTTTHKLVMEQADLLTKMTAQAVAKKSDPTNSPN